MHCPLTLSFATVITMMATVQITTQEPLGQEPLGQLSSQVSRYVAARPTRDEPIHQSFVHQIRQRHAHYHSASIATDPPLYQSMMSRLKQHISNDLAAFVAPTTSIATQPLQTNPAEDDISEWDPFPTDWANFMTACRDPLMFPNEIHHRERMNLSSSCFMEACNSFASRHTETDTFVSLEEQNTAGHSINGTSLIRIFITGVPNIPRFADIDGCEGEQNCTRWCHNYARNNVYDGQALRDFYIELGVIIGSLAVLSIILFTLARCCNKRRLPWAGRPKEVEELSRLPEEKGVIAPMPNRRAGNASGAELEENLPNSRVVITQPVPNTTSTGLTNNVARVPTSATTTEVVPVTDGVPATEVMPVSNSEMANNVAPVPHPVANTSVQPTTNAQTTTKVIPVPATSHT